MTAATGAQHRRGAPEDYEVAHQANVVPPCPPLPPLYPHCMRHQEHRCLYGAQYHQQQQCHQRIGSTYGRGGPCPLPSPYQYVDGHASGCGQGPRDHSGQPAGHLVLRVVSEASAEPDKKVNFEVVSVDVRHGRFRKAVPRMPLFLSVFLCVINMLAPGIGTFLAAFTVFCGCKTEYDDKCTAFFYNVLASILQITTALIVVGWVWSIMWGITFVSISFTKRDEDLIASL